MKKYIDADKVLGFIKQYTPHFNGFTTMACIKTAIENMPAADVVEVVRCRGCSVPHNKWMGCPNLNGLIPPPDFYCAKGERRTGDEL